MREPYDPFVFFERSSPALFNLTVYSSWTQDLDFYSQISRAILENLDRLRRLTIDVVNLDEIAPLFEAWSDRDAPNFAYLEVGCSDCFEPEKEITTYLSCGASLSSIKLKGLRYKFLPSLRYLTILEIDRLRPDSNFFHDLFNHFPGLETLIVGVLSAPSETSDPILPSVEISVPSLKTLAINLDNDHTENCSCGLYQITAENLEHLEISHYGTTFADHYVSLASHFKPPPHLRKMRIRSHLFMEEDMDFLALLPNATCLEIVGFPSHRDPGAGLPIVNLQNLGAITIDLTPTMSKYSSDFDLVAFRGILHDTRDLSFSRPVVVCCDCDDNALAAWKMVLGNRFLIRSMPLPPGHLDSYFVSYDDFLDRLSGSSQDENYDWDGDDYDDYDYEDYDEEADYPDESGIGSEGEDEEL